MTYETTGETHWRSISRDNVTTLYGKTAESRIADSDDPARIFSWLICQSYDDKGNAVIYEYVKENADDVDRSLGHLLVPLPCSITSNLFTFLIS
jgi:Salmonella virulence plasmid 65kDa B protein